MAVPLPLAARELMGPAVRLVPQADGVQQFQRTGAGGPGPAAAQVGHHQQLFEGGQGRQQAGLAAEATAAIAALPGAPRVPVVTTYDTDADTLPAIEAGATGYLLEDAPPEELAAAVRSAAAGRTTLAPAVKSHLVHIYSKLGVDSRMAAVAAATARGLIRRRSGR